MKSRFLGLVVFCLGLCVASWPGEVRGALQVDEPAEGAVVELLSASPRAYLALDEGKLKAALFARDAKYVKRHPESTNDVFRLDVTPSPLRLSWHGAEGPVSYSLVNIRDGAVVARGQSAEGSAAVFNLELDAAYRLEVSAGTERAERLFRTAATAPRVLNGGVVPNVRDLGGWKGLGGKTIRQGRLFRSAGLNQQITEKVARRAEKAGGAKLTLGEYVNFVTETNRATFADVMKVRTDVDLRFTNEVVRMTGSPLGPEVKWVNAPLSPYYKPSREQAGSLKAILDPANHPLVFHCAAGKDRTGTVAAIILGVLGVSEADIWRDYGFIGDRLNTQRFQALFDSLKKSYGTDSFSTACEAHLLKLGISSDEIARFRAVMLDSSEGGVR